MGLCAKRVKEYPYLASDLILFCSNEVNERYPGRSPYKWICNKVQMGASAAACDTISANATRVANSRCAQKRFVQTQAKTFLCLFIDKMTEDYCVAQSAEVFQ